MPRPQLFVVYAAGGSVGTGVLCAPCPGLASSSHTHTYTYTHAHNCMQTRMHICTLFLFLPFPRSFRNLLQQSMSDDTEDMMAVASM